MLVSDYDRGVKMTGSGASAYRGEDRRQRQSEGHRGEVAKWGPLAFAVCAIVGMAIAFSVGPLLLVSPNPPLAAGLEPLLDSAAVAVAVIIGVLLVVRWRLLGQSFSLWLAGGLLTYGLITVSVGNLGPLVWAGAEPQVLLWVHPSSRLVFIGLMLAAVVWPDVDAELRPRRVAATAIAGTTALTVLFQLLPDLGRALAGANDGVAQQLPFALGSLLLITAYSVVGVLMHLRGARLPRPLFSWFGVLMLALVTAELHRLVPTDQVGLWSLGDSALRLGGLLAAVVGSTRDLAQNFGEQGGRLLESVATGATAEARIRAEAAANEERAHEARNALAAIEGATRTLEHYRDRLDSETRASLTEAITGEIARLQGLVSVERTADASADFTVERALRSVLTAARSVDGAIGVDIPVDLRAFGVGARTAEVVQNLLVNAQRYAPGGDICISARAAQGGVIIRVDDRGPGVPEAERRLIFGRGQRGSTAQRTDGSGLGLYVSRAIMREQGGNLWVEERPGGGSSFALWLPAPP